MYNDNIDEEDYEESEPIEENKKTKVDELFDDDYEEENTRKRGKGKHSK